MKEIKDLYRAIAKVNSTISRANHHLDAKEQKKRCGLKKKRCKERNPSPTPEQLDACIFNAWNEEFENAPSGADPMDVLCAVYRRSCNCEVNHKVKKCEWNRAMANCMEGPGDGSPEDARCPQGPFGYHDCSQITSDPRGKYCSQICRIGCGNPEDDCGPGPSNPEFWKCEMIRDTLSELNRWNGEGAPPHTTFYGEYRDCVINVTACERCDCKKTLADKLKKIATTIRRIARGWPECKIDLEYGQWYETFDVDECKAGLNCGPVDPVDPVDPPDDTDIGVEEIAKGQGCCVNGSHEPWIETPADCANRGGVWGDLTEMGCVAVPK
jgi:hypothetical protein